MPRLPASARDWISIVVINASIPALILWQLHGGDVDRHSALLACWVSLAFVNAVFLGAAWQRGRRKGTPVAGGVYAAALVLAVAAGFSTTSWVNHHQPPQTYLQMALSDTPLDQIRPARSRIVVHLLRERIAAGRAYSEAAAHIQPISPPLYSAESFSSTANIGKTTSGLQQAWQVDKTYADRLRSTDATFNSEMAAVDPKFLTSWNAARAEQDKTQTHVNELEAQWVQSVQSLYAYAAAHQREIRLEKKTLVFSSAKARTEFRSLAETSQKLQQQMLALQQKLVSTQQKASVVTGYP
jgi:hypothetical protein